MRSTKTNLEQDIIKKARAFIATRSPLDELDLRAAVLSLDSYIEAITDDPGAANHESWTSINAAQLSAITAGSLRRRIVDQIYLVSTSPLRGLTDDELERRLNKPHTSVSSARNWLVQRGWLIDSGDVRQTRSLRPATVWIMTDQAKQRIRRSQWPTYLERAK